MSTSQQSPIEDLDEKATLRARIDELQRENDLLKQAQRGYAEARESLQTFGTDGTPELASLQQTYGEAPIGLCYLDTNLRFVFINEWMAAINGLSVEEHLGRSIGEILPDIAAGVDAQLRQVLETGEPIVEGTVEAETVAQPGVKRHFRHNYDAVRSADGAIVGVSCAVQDITERKQAVDSLHEREQLYRSAIAAADAVVYQKEYAGNSYTHMDASITDLIGYDVDEVTADLWFKIITQVEMHGPLRGKSQSELRRLFKNGELPVWQSDYKCKAKNGETRWLNDSSVPIHDGAGKVVGCLGVLQDITERKLAGEKLRDSEERLTLALDAISEGLWDWNIATGEVFYSPQWCKTLGFDPSEVEPHGRFWDSLVHSEDMPRLTTVLNAHFDQKTELYECEVRLRKKSGEYQWHLERGKVVARDKDGKPLRMVGVVADITERKLAEQASQDKQVQLDNLLSNVDAIILEGDPFDIYYVGGQVEKILGYPKEMWFEHPDGPVGFWSGLLHPDDADSIEICRQAIERGEDHSFEYRLIAKSGKAIWFYDSVMVECVEGKPVKTRSVMIDITERKQAEEALHESEERMRLLLEGAFEGIVISEKATIIESNQAFADMFGYALSEVVGLSPVELTTPESARQIAERIAKGDENRYEIVGQKKDGTLFGVELIGKNCMYRGRKARITAMRDITERKQAEEALQASEALFRGLAETLKPVLFVVDPDRYEVLFVNRAYEEVWGRTLKSLYEHPLSWADAVVSDDRERVHAALEKQQRTGEFDEEFRIKRPDGSIRWISDRVVPILTNEGKPFRLVGIAEDITERKLAEGALRESEERVRLILNATHDSVFLIDSSNWTILTVNQTGAKNLGRSVKEVVGLKIDDLMPADDARRRKELCEQVILSGELLSFEDERQGRHFDNSIYPVCDNHGTVMQLAVFAQDITERKQAEEARRVSETRFRELLEAEPDGVIVVNQEGRITLVNKQTVDMFGYRREELLGETIELLVPQRLREKHLGHFAGFRSQPTARPMGTELEVIGRRKDGSEFPADVSLSPLETDEGLFVMSIVRDITERKKTEEALRESELRFRATFESASIPIALIDENARMIETNPRCHKLFGYSGEELAGLKFTEITHPDDIEKGWLLFKQLVEGKTSDVQLEKRYLHKDGSVILANTSASAIRDSHGRFLYLVAMVQDITESRKAESALRDSEQRFREVFEAAPSGMAIADAEGKSLRYNSALQNMLGYSEEELRSMDISQYTHADDLAEGKQLFAELRAGKRDQYQVEKRYIRKDGKVLWGNLAFSSVRNDQGEIQYLIASVKDITERKQAELALRESEERYRRVAEDQNEFIVRWLPDGTRTFVNEAYCRYFGLTREQAIGTNFYPLVSDENRDAVVKRISTLNLENPVSTGEHRVSRPDGSEGWQQWTDRAIFDDKDNLVEFQSVGREITERKRAEETLRESELKYRSLVESVNTVPWKVDLTTGRFSFIGQQVEQLLGYPADSWVDVDTWAERIHPEDRENARNYCRDATLRGEDHELEYRALAADETHVWIRDVVTVIMGDEGPKEIIGFMFDITEHKQAEEQARQLQADLAHLSRLSTMGEMAAGLAHELNQPLTVITNYAQGCVRRLKSKAISEEELEGVLGRIATQARRSSSIIRGLGNLVRKSSALRSDINVNQSIMEVAELASAEAAQHCAKAKFELEPNLPPVKADQTQLQQVILNLVQNGCEAMEDAPSQKREVTVRTRQREDSQLEITVVDYGAGISEASTERLFEPFFTTKANGIGMGLAISRSIVESHGGRLWATPNRAGGTSFHFTLPIVGGGDGDE